MIRYDMIIIIVVVNAVFWIKPKGSASIGVDKFERIVVLDFCDVRFICFFFTYSSSLCTPSRSAVDANQAHTTHIES